PTYINMIERGRRIPSVETVLQLAEALQLTQEEQRQLVEVARHDQRLHSKTVLTPHREDWGEAPDVRELYGREKELAQLENWIVGEQCRLIAVLGLGGVGKTALSTRLATKVKEGFNYVFWRSLL